MMQFQKAEKQQSKLRATLNGPAGSGKTYSALVLARALGGRVALVDTEHGRASKYAGKFDFDTLKLDVFSYENLQLALRAAADAKYDILIVDSLSHFWAGKGGALEEVDKVTANSRSKNAFSAGWSVITPKQNEMVNALLAWPGHVISTMRKKMEYALETNDKGQLTPRKVGLAPVQRDGIEYEYDVIFDMDLGGSVHVGKSVCELLPQDSAFQRTEFADKAGVLVAWLNEGKPPPPPHPLEVKLNEASSPEALEKLLPELKAIAPLDAALPMLRELYAKRRDEVGKK